MAAGRGGGVAGRRAHRSGSLREKPPGSGRFEITVRPAPGAPQDLWLRLPQGTSREEAEARLALMVAQVKAGTYVPRRAELSAVRTGASRTFGELAAEYAEHVRRQVRTGDLRPSRANDVDSMLNAHLLPAFGSEDIRNIETRHLSVFVKGLANGVSSLPRSEKASAQLAWRTVNHYIILLKQMFAWALEEPRHYVTMDPAAELQLLTAPRGTGDADEVEDEDRTDAYEPAHAQWIIRLLPAGGYRVLGALGFGLGLRLGEGLGTQLRDWNAREQKLQLRRALRREGGRMRVTKGLKSMAGRRNPKCGHDLAAVIEQQVDDADQAGRAATDLLLSNSAGNAINPSNFLARIWYPAVYVGWVKVATDRETRWWLSLVPAEYRDAAELLTLDDIHLDAVLHARHADFDGRQLRYVDTDEKTRVTAVPGALAARLRQRYEDAVAVERSAAHTAAAAPGITRKRRLALERRASRAAETVRERRVFPGHRGQEIARAQFLEAVFRGPLTTVAPGFDRRFHRTRHSFVSYLNAARMDLPESIRRQVAGHSDRSTHARYNHPLRQHLDQPVDVFQVVLNGALPADTPSAGGDAVTVSREEYEALLALRDLASRAA